MKSATFFALLASATLLPTCGCGPVEEAKPSYADLVVIYNAELSALDRLEKKKADLIASFEKQLTATGDDALRALSDVLGTAAANRDATPLDATDPNEMLDQAVEQAERIEQATSQLIEAATQQPNAAEGAPPTVESLYTDEMKAQLAELDGQIALQQARVDRARAARDAAEARQ